MLVALLVNWSSGRLAWNISLVIRVIRVTRHWRFFFTGSCRVLWSCSYLSLCCNTWEIAHWKMAKGLEMKPRSSQSQLGAILVNGSNGWLRSRSMSLVCNHSTPCDVSVFRQPYKQKQQVAEIVLHSWSLTLFPILPLLAIFGTGRLSWCLTT